jgi:hypothetical protein
MKKVRIMPIVRLFTRSRRMFYGSDEMRNDTKPIAKGGEDNADK